MDDHLVYQVLKETITNNHKTECLAIWKRVLDKSRKPNLHGGYNQLRSLKALLPVLVNAQHWLYKVKRCYFVMSVVYQLSTRTSLFT